MKIPWNELLLGFAVSQPFTQFFSKNWFIGSRKPVLMKDGGTHCEIIIISKKPRVVIIILHILFLIASKLKILTTKNLMLALVETALNLPQSVLEPPIKSGLESSIYTTWLSLPFVQRLVSRSGLSDPVTAALDYRNHILYFYLEYISKICFKIWNLLITWKMSPNLMTLWQSLEF